jgi:hypothetical protein
MSDPFKEFVEEMARLAVPEDDTEENRGRSGASTAAEKGARHRKRPRTCRRRARRPPSALTLSASPRRIEKIEAP